MSDNRILLRDHALETLGRGFNDYQCCVLSLESADDTAALHHFSRLLATVKSVAATLRDLRAIGEAERQRGAA